jgi:hypothetical protein
MRPRLVGLQLVIVAALLGVSVVARQRSALETIDLMPLYWQFWDKAQSLPEGEQIRLFREMVVQRRPEVYNAAVMSVPGNKSFADALPEIYPQAVQWTVPHQDVIRKLSNEVTATLPEHEQSFRKEFPDFKYKGRVYFLYALGAFDGAARTVEGRPALLFGLDAMAAIYGDTASVGPLFHHELFHAYHGSWVGDTGRGLPLYLSVWSEGLATLVARRLNPSASDVAIYGLPSNTPQRVRDDLPKLASLLRARMDSTLPEDYDDFFIGNDPKAPRPRRSGYYLGYLVAARLNEDRSLRDLARLKGQQLRRAIDQALADPARLAATETSPRRPIGRLECLAHSHGAASCLAASQVVFDRIRSSSVTSVGLVR